MSNNDYFVYFKQCLEIYAICKVSRVQPEAAKAFSLQGSQHYSLVYLCYVHAFIANKSQFPPYEWSKKSKRMPFGNGNEIRRCIVRVSYTRLRAHSLIESFFVKCQSIRRWNETLEISKINYDKKKCEEIFCRGWE